MAKRIGESTADHSHGWIFVQVVYYWSRHEIPRYTGITVFLETVYYRRPFFKYHASLVWNVLHAARWTCRTQKIAKKSPSGHHRTTLSDYICATKARIDNRKKLVKQQCLSLMASQYRELWPNSGSDLLVSLGHPCKLQRVSRLGSVTARHSSSGRQPNFAALNRGRQLYSAGRPSRWALAHILVARTLQFLTQHTFYFMTCFLWSPYVIGQTIIFSSCFFFFLFSFFFFFFLA